MKEINCPMCGRPNPEELEVCQFCEARLKPITTDQLSGSTPPIHAGDEPTKVPTSELEPILPQWLREIRQQARESSDETEEQPSGEEEAEKESPLADDNLLAGLASQADEDEEVPDWLANIRGDKAQLSEEEPPEEESLSGLQGLLGEQQAEESQPEESEIDSSIPDWMSNLQAESGTGEEQPATSNLDDSWLADLEKEDSTPIESTKDSAPIEMELPDWLRPAGDESTGQAEEELPGWMQAEEGSEQPEEPSQPVAEESSEFATEGDISDWLTSLDNEEVAEQPAEEPEQPISEGDLPDWLSTLGGQPSEPESQPPAEEPVESAAGSEMPDWLSSLDSEEAEEKDEKEPAQPATEGELPDWLSNLGEETPEPESQKPAEEPSEFTPESETPDWLSSLGDEEAEEKPEEETAQLAMEEGLPDWLSSMDEVTTEPEPQKPAEETTRESAEPAAEEGLPDWLSSMGEETTEPGLQESAEEPSGEFATEGETPDWLSSLGEETAEEKPEEEAQPMAEEGLPDWLSSISSEESPTSDELAFPPEETETTATDEEMEEVEQPSVPQESASAFSDDEGAPISSGDVDAIFSMDMPDWLSDVGAEGKVGETREGIEQEPDLTPAELPNWVQAMRPVEAVISESEGAGADQTVEETGPLAGLRGVLPAVTGVGPSSKPKSYAIKLQASTEQQSSAAMLEQLLNGESQPSPMKAQSVIASQRIFRWLIAVLLLVLTFGFSGSQLNPMPLGLPQETWAAVQVVEGVPENAPILLVFDYQAALAGELEASAASLIDHMVTLRHPRIALLSSTPVGVGLAERFMTKVPGATQLGENLVNLGYLPGGASGVLGFAQSPPTVMALDATGQAAWNLPVLQGVTQLSNFAAIILLTDDAEATRIWVEQTEIDRGSARFVVVSSAQSGPMIQPYVQSGQIQGLVVGLDGGASVEQVNHGEPGLARRYWDSYGFGLLFAALIIAVGSLWSLLAGWQARRSLKGEN